MALFFLSIGFFTLWFSGVSIQILLDNTSHACITGTINWQAYVLSIVLKYTGCRMFLSLPWQ